MSGTRSSLHSNTKAALEALERGYQALPIRAGAKNPHVSAWTHVRWDADNPDALISAFEEWHDEGATNVGLLLGKPSGGLIDIDLDHPRAMRLRDHFLPPTPMRSGRPGRPFSHFWYKVDEGLPATRRYKMPDGAVSVELRSTGSQTVIPPSVHPSGETYRWEGTKWGGKKGPLVVDGKVLSVQVALLGMGCVLIDQWPQRGGRHDAYLALAGGLLRFGREGVHPYWERNLPVLIRALAMATNDEDGPEAREGEVMPSTLARLRSGENAVGFTRLSELIGVDHADLIRRMAREVESLAGFSADTAVVSSSSRPLREVAEEAMDEELESTLPPEDRDPLGERVGTWQPVDLDPYLLGEVRVPQPTVLRRSDGKGLFYEGRVNSLYGQSEAAKSWMALVACQQEMALGERVMYLDFEDEPTFTISRLRLLGAGDDDVRHQFTYVRPEDPLMDMQRNRWGQSVETDLGRLNHELFALAVERVDPSLIIVDGMTVLYGLHGLDSNDAVSTDIITTWLKRLCRNGRSTVIVIDHTGKGAGRGASPIGAHHKIAMVQGTALQVYPVSQPMPGHRGEVQLLVHKDRPGAVRAISTSEQPAIAAVVVLDSRTEGCTYVSIDPATPGDVVVGGTDNDGEALRKAAERAEKERQAAEAERFERQKAHEELVDAVLAFFGSDVDATHTRAEAQDAVVEALAPREVHEREVREVIWGLVQEGLLHKQGERRWARYSIVVPTDQP